MSSRSIARLVLLAAFVTVGSSSRAALIGYWNLDEGAGTTAADTSGVGTPHTGTLGTTAAGAQLPAWIAGRFGSALDFNRLNDGNGGRITVPFQADLRLNAAFTISFWYRPGPNIGTFPGPMRIGSQSATTGTTIGWGFFRSQSAGNVVFKRGNVQPNIYPARLNFGQWYHIVLRHDGGSANTAIMFGVSTNTFTQAWLDATTSATFEFGRMDQHDDCDLDDIAFFDEAVPLERIYTINSVPSNLGLDYNLADVRALWAIFDGGPGSMGTVKGISWAHTTTLPGSTTPGAAYLSGTKWYVVLSPTAGLVANAILLGDISPAGIGNAGTTSYPETPEIGASARFIFDLGATTTIGGGANDLFEITGDLNPVGNTIVVNPLAPLANGTYRLFNYTGAKSDSFNSSVVHNSRYTMTLDESTAGQVNLTVSGANSDVRWFSSGSGAWDFASVNWSNTVAMAADRFFQADSVTFDDSAAFPSNITIAAAVFPNAMTVNSSALNYSFSGNPIGGLPGGLTKDGTGLLTLSSANLFHGPVNVNAGTLRASFGALGSTNGGTTVASGATLDLSGAAIVEPLTLAGPGQNSTGAVINTGAALVNTGINGPVTLTGDTTFGGVNRFDVFGGSLAGNGFKLTKTGAPEIALSNLRDTGLGDIDVQRGQLTILGSTTMGDSTKAVTVRPGTTLAHWASGTNIHNKPLAMEAARLLNGTSPAGDVATNVASVSLTGTNTFDGGSSIALLGEVSGTGSVVKNGTGTLRLGGTNIYTGNTTINAGTLALVNEGTIATTPMISLASGSRLSAVGRVDGTITLASGQTLAGGGAVDGHVTAGTGAGISPGFSASTLTITNALNLTGGATLTYELTSAATEGGGVNDLINVGGALNLGGVTTVKILPAGSLVAGPYTLINYTGALSGGAANLNPVSDTRYALTLDTTTTPGKVLLTTVGAAQTLEWVGGEPGAETLWDIRTTANWLGGGQDQFYNADSVVFNDLAVEFNVTLVGELYPSSIRAEPDTTEFVFGGSGRLRGGSLEKALGGKLTIANTSLNDYPGPTVISGGTLQVGTGGTFGNLGPNAITNNGVLVLNRSDDMAFANIMVGSGTLQKEGGNLLTIGASLSNNAGSIVVNGGTLRPTTTNAIGTPAGGITINSGATLDINAQVLHMEPVTVQGTGVGGNGALVNASATGQNNALRFVTLSGDTTVSGVGRWDIRDPGAGASLTGNGFALTKLGANQISLVSVGAANLGAVNVQQGLLSVEGNTSLGSAVAGGISVNSGATLMFWGSTVPHDKSLSLNGAARLFKDNGTITLNGGISLTGSNAIDVASNAGADVTANGQVTGGGLLNKLGAGNLFLTAANDYSGGTLISAGNLFLGNGGTSGSVLGSITDNATLSVFRSDAVTLANNVSGIGNLNLRTAAGLMLDGTASLNIGGTVNVGQDSFGLLVIQPGAVANIGSIFLGNPANISGNTIQLGGNVTVTNQHRVGHWPNEISTYTMGGGTLSITATPAGVVNPNAVAEQAGILYLGIDGIGIFTQTGGVASAHGIVLDARGNTAAIGGTNETFNLEGGTFILGPSGIKSGSLDANTTINVNLGGGTLGSSANWTSVLAMTLTGTNGDVAIDTAANTVRLNGVLSGPGGLRKEGTGTLILQGLNTYAGTTLVNNGTLMGTGSVSGPLVVSAGGTLAPGLSIGTFTASGAVTLGGTAVFEVNKTGSTLTSDLLAGVSTLTCGGGVTILATGDPLADGDTFTLIAAANYLGEFASFDLPPLAPGLFWDTTQLCFNGTVRVTDNLPPLAGDASFSTVRNVAYSFSVTKLLQRSSDPESDPLSVTGVSASTNGASVVLNSGIITYTPVNGFVGADRFRYTIADGQGGLGFGDIEALVYPGAIAGENVVSLSFVDGSFHFTFAGIPGRVYGIERAAAVDGPWTQIASVTCDENGLTTFIDPNSPTGSAFYRTVYPAAP